MIVNRVPEHRLRSTSQKAGLLSQVCEKDHDLHTGADATRRVDERTVCQASRSASHAASECAGKGGRMLLFEVCLIFALICTPSQTPVLARSGFEILKYGYTRKLLVRACPEWRSLHARW